MGFLIEAAVLAKAQRRKGREGDAALILRHLTLNDHQPAVGARLHDFASSTIEFSRRPTTRKYFSIRPARSWRLKNKCDDAAARIPRPIASVIGTHGHVWGKPAAALQNFPRNPLSIDGVYEAA